MCMHGKGCSSEVNFVGVILLSSVSCMGCLDFHVETRLCATHNTWGFVLVMRILFV